MGSTTSEFPAEFDIAPPLIDGQRSPGGGLNSAVDRLNMLRDAIANIQAELGTNPEGSESSLADRLAVRISQSGITRGLCEFFNRAGPKVTANVGAGNRTSILVTERTATKQTDGTYHAPWNGLYSTTNPIRVFVQPHLQWSSITSNSILWRACHVDQSSIDATGVTFTVYQATDTLNPAVGSEHLAGAIWSPVTTASITVSLLIIGGQ